MQQMFNCLQGLKTSDNPAHRSEYARFTTAGYAACRGRFWKKAAVAGAAARWIEERHLTFEFEYAAKHQRPAARKSRFVVQVSRRKVVGSIHNQIILPEDFCGVFGLDAIGVCDNADVRIERFQPIGCGMDFRISDARCVVQKLTLEIVSFNRVQISDAQRANASGGEVQSRRAAQSACADDEHFGSGQPALSFQPNFIK